ncbi:ATP-binding cassette domain-containing protein [Luteococcus sediminum]
MIEIDHLTKRYGGFTAVDDVSFTALPGRVTGFLGPNGAGKSTLLRMVCGLTPPTSGRATVLGVAYAELPNPIQHVGVMLDAAAQHPGRTGAEVLRLAGLIAGVSKDRVTEMAEMVGLTQTETKRRVKDYSLGMRQRLGIAGALMGDPKVLILDEPANGLDPAGIHWMRELLADYSSRGGTVLLSSHLLGEVQMIAHDLVMIGHGRIVAQGSLQEMLAAKELGSVVDSTTRQDLVDAVRSSGGRIDQRPDGTFNVDLLPAAMGQLAIERRIPLVLLRERDQTNLEELFLSLTQDTARQEIR